MKPADFPLFLRAPEHKIDEGYKEPGVAGWRYEDADGVQVICWTCHIDGVSPEDRHDFDEYMVVVKGEFRLSIKDEIHYLHSGDDFHIPAGTIHTGAFTAGTRTIHFFGGKRA